MAHATDLPLELWIMIFELVYAHLFHDYLLDEFPRQCRHMRCLRPDLNRWNSGPEPSTRLGQRLFAAASAVLARKSNFAVHPSVQKAHAIGSHPSTRCLDLVLASSNGLAGDTYFLSAFLALFPRLERCKLSLGASTSFGLLSSLDVPQSIQWLTLTRCRLSKHLFNKVLALPALRRLHLLDVKICDAWDWDRPVSEPSSERPSGRVDTEPNRLSSGDSTSGLRFLLLSAVALCTMHEIFQSVDGLASLEVGQACAPVIFRLKDVLPIIPCSVKSLTVGFQEKDFKERLAFGAYLRQLSGCAHRPLLQLQHLCLHVGFCPKAQHCLLVCRILEELGSSMPSLSSLELVYHVEDFLAKMEDDCLIACSYRERLTICSSTLAQSLSVTTPSDPSRYLHFPSLRELSLPIHVGWARFIRPFWCPNLEQIIEQRELQTFADRPWCRADFQDRSEVF